MSERPLPRSLQARLDRVELSDKVRDARQVLAEKIRRSVYVYKVDCGGCNGCDIEMLAATTPAFDCERFGIKTVVSPRQADIIVYTGAVTRAMRTPALRAYEQAPDPKLVMSFGACACSGGIFYDSYCVWGGVDKIVPVDVYVPGCPPSPDQALYGFAVALGLLEQRIHAGVQDGTAAAAESIQLDDRLPYDLMRTLQRRARQMAGYRDGHDIAAEFVDMLQTQGLLGDDKGSQENAAAQELRQYQSAQKALEQSLDESDDPRHTEIIIELARTYDEWNVHQAQ